LLANSDIDYKTKLLKLFADRYLKPLRSNLQKTAFHWSNVQILKFTALLTFLTETQSRISLQFNDLFYARVVAAKIYTYLPDGLLRRRRFAL